MSGPPLGVSSVLAGRYTIERVLGRGASATVYLALDATSGNRVALKVLRPELAQSAASDRFLREIRVTTRLKHPNVLQVLDAGESAGRLYFALPYMEGAALRQRMDRDKQLPLSECVRIVATIAETLDYAHEQGLIHRDVKPENILFSNGEARLADFGIARALESAMNMTADSTTTGVVRGTVAYMSPEQASATGKIDGRSDVYSLGCVLYEMIAGMPAFLGPTPEAVLAQRFSHPPRDIRVYRSTVSDELSAVVMKALEFSPADRFQTGAEFAAALRALEAKDALSQTGHRKTPGPMKARRFSRAWIATALVAVAGSAIVAVAMTLAPPPVTTQPRIAVMYFDNPSRDSALGRMADGLTEELIYELSGVNAFRVISKHGVRPYRAATVPVDSLAKALGVSMIVEGSVVKIPAGVRVLVRLLDARTNTYVDSISVEQPSTQLVPMEREVARQLAASLRIRLGRDVRLRQTVSGTSNQSARDYVLRAQRERQNADALATQPHPQDLRAALTAYRRADSLLQLAHSADRRWARPLIESAWIAYATKPLLSNEERKPSLLRGIAAADSALRASPRHPEALEARGALQIMLALEGHGDSTRLVAAEADLRAALDQDSTLAGAWASLSHVLWLKGSHADASLAAQRALQEDAYLSRLSDIFLNLFFDALMLGDVARADEWCRRGQQSAPNDWQFVDCELTLMRHDTKTAPDTVRAWALVRRLDQMDPMDRARIAGRPYHPTYRRMVAATISARAGDTALARAELARARRAAGRDSSLLLDLALDEAYLRLVLGDTARARRLMGQLLRERPLLRPLVERDPLLKQLR